MDQSAASKPIQETKTGKAAAGPVRWLDERVRLATLVKVFGRKVFPDHWSFLLGEIALWSFVVLLLSGTFLTFWFVPSQGEVIYDGSYAPLRGLEMSEAYASTLELSFDVRGGLLMRQIHHWSAMLFIAGRTPTCCGLVNSCGYSFGPSVSQPSGPRSKAWFMPPRVPGLRNASCRSGDAACVGRDCAFHPVASHHVASGGGPGHDPGRPDSSHRDAGSRSAGRGQQRRVLRTLTR